LKIHVITKTTGEYEDRYKRVMLAFLDEKLARTYIKIKNEINDDDAWNAEEVELVE